jgi:cell division protein FtsA
MEYIAILDIGSSKMLAAAAAKSDRKNIFAIERIDSAGSIRRGLIHKPEEAAPLVLELVRRLNGKLAASNLPQLKQIYLGVGGQGLHAKPYSAEKDIAGQVVNDAMLDQLCDECHSERDPRFELIEIVPEYFIDGRAAAPPQGAQGQKLEARFQCILGHPSDEVAKILSGLNVKVLDTLVSPLATAQYVLTPTEKNLGCALVESGADLTYLSIYKDGFLRHLIALPLAGNAITRDVASLNKTDDEAEILKITQGDASCDDPADEINSLIRARADEIIANLLHQIKTAGYEASLPAGFILTGGSSRLKGFDKLLKEQTGQPVRCIEDSPEQSCARGLLLLGKENCAKEVSVVQLQPPTPPQPPRPPKRGFKDRIERWTNDLFDQQQQQQQPENN